MHAKWKGRAPGEKPVTCRVKHLESTEEQTRENKQKWENLVIEILLIKC